MNRSLAASFLLAISLIGCATTPVRNPEAGIKLEEANEALDQLTRRVDEFYTKFEMLREDTVSLYRQPGWSEMEEIIEQFSTSDNPEDDAFSSLEARDANNEWINRWGLPWESLFSRYLSLVQRCNAMEIRRLVLLSELRGAQSKFLGLVMDFSEQKEGKQIFDVAEVLGKSADELETYAPNSMGLYDVSPP